MARGMMDMDMAMEEDEMAPEGEEAPGGGAMDLSKILESLDSMSAMITKMRDMIPTDSAEEQAEEVDEATSEQEMEGVETESLKPSAASVAKDMKKASAIAMIKKQLG